MEETLPILNQLQQEFPEAPVRHSSTSYYRTQAQPLRGSGSYHFVTYSFGKDCHLILFLHGGSAFTNPLVP
jgi:hypothetical protein